MMPICVTTAADILVSSPLVLHEKVPGNQTEMEMPMNLNRHALSCSANSFWAYTVTHIPNPVCMTLPSRDDWHAMHQ